MRIIKLDNVKSHLQVFGIIVGNANWVELLSDKLNEYLIYMGWGYTNDDDTLDLQLESDAIVLDNISDFGEVIDDVTIMG